MRILDLFCGAGGAAMGLHRALPSAEIVGVDVEPQSRYPFSFIRSSWETVDTSTFDFIWASPVCKGYSALRHYGTNSRRTGWPDQVPGVREKLMQSGLPYVIENVPRSPLRTDSFLCGQMFGLPLIRHRLFETSFYWLRPPHICARRGAVARREVICICGHGGGTNAKTQSNRLLAWTKAEAQKALGIDWMTRAEMAQAIPPAYSEFIFKQWMQGRREMAS